MVRKKKTVSAEETVVPKAVEKPEKKTISPMDRWKMVAEAAYYRAQKRGFIGGNPMDDWTKAEREIDAKYAVDYRKIMVALDSSEVMEQLIGILGEILRQPNLDLGGILEDQRKNIEALTDANKVIFDNARGIIERQVGMFRETMEQTVSLMDNTLQTKSTRDMAGQQAELVRLGMEKSLASMRDITESITKANAQAFDIANKRMAENMSEFKRFVRNLK
uniref:Phasin family protein n=1 Tax=Candidatus Kentrum sp. DK TaxID=2126562 RepID=A0A450SNL9_9GAMM|nr:MAG: phasin family protein [Candidatus Kentron sp. DK]